MCRATVAAATLTEELLGMINIGIVGGTGYTGVELVRLLSRHPGAQLSVITSRGEAGTPIAKLYPSLRGVTDLVFEDPARADLSACDVVFFATPHNVAMRSVPELLASGQRVIDLSADFRLRDVALWEQWYGERHAAPELCAEAVYGLPEMNREAIRKAQLVACAGCYPTSVQLGFWPLLHRGLCDPSQLIASSASGVSGAGRQGKIDNLLTEAGESFKAYGVAGHRHLPEIEQGLSAMAGEAVQLTFVPHLVPMSRGIHSTLFATVSDHDIDLQAVFENHYAQEPFVDVLPAGETPRTASVRGANVCRIAVTRPQGRDVVVVTVAIDNLVKGASGQAIQVMNLMFDLPEVTGLDVVALMP
jgi:N-acetyl-gamma-glutamyl-phosphate reductase